MKQKALPERSNDVRYKICLGSFVLIVGWKASGFHWQIISLPTALVMLRAKNKLCHDNTAWWDSKSWNSEKPSTASPRSLRVKRMHPRNSLRDWPNPGQKFVADLGKANCREENMKRYSCLFTLCISTAMLVSKKV